MIKQIASFLSSYVSYINEEEEEGLLSILKEEIENLSVLSPSLMLQNIPVSVELPVIVNLVLFGQGIKVSVKLKHERQNYQVN